MRATSPALSATFKLRSAETGTEYHVYEHVPASPAVEGWPAVAFMDGDDQFGPAVAAYEQARAAAAVPPLLLVGIGYGASYTKPGNRRGRDYTPVAHSDEPTSGAADRFLDFLTGTFWSELARRHPVHPTRRGVAGHSLGSLLVLHALFQGRPFFTDFLASAPSIWWADRAILGQAKRLRDQQSSLAGRLFLAVGEDDSRSMTGDLALLEQQLADRPFAGLRINSRRFPARNHYDVLPDAFGDGLRTLFGNSQGPGS